MQCHFRLALIATFTVVVSIFALQPSTNPPQPFTGKVIGAGKEIEEHEAKGEIGVQCLEGRVAFTAFGKTLETGTLFYLPTGESHTVKGIEDASLLLTILLPKC